LQDQRHLLAGDTFDHVPPTIFVFGEDYAQATAVVI
jgi:hypothetical protein